MYRIIYHGIGGKLITVTKKANSISILDAVNDSFLNVLDGQKTVLFIPASSLVSIEKVKVSLESATADVDTIVNHVE